MKKMLTLSVMFILCLLTFATDFMRIKLKDGNIARYEEDNICNLRCAHGLVMLAGPSDS